jgi:hypothetical protein
VVPGEATLGTTSGSRLAGRGTGQTFTNPAARACTKRRCGNRCVSASGSLTSADVANMSRQSVRCSPQESSGASRSILFASEFNDRNGRSRSFQLMTKAKIARLASHPVTAPCFKQAAGRLKG